MFTNFYFSENLLVAAANRFKVLKILISLKVTVCIQDRRLWSVKALDVQGFEWKSNCTAMAKYTYEFKHKIEREKVKPGQAIYFTFSRGVFRTLSNI